MADVDVQAEESLTKEDPALVFERAVDKANTQTNGYNPLVVEPTEAEGITNRAEAGY